MVLRGKAAYMTGWRRLQSTEWMLITLWLVGFACYAIAPITDPDTPWHIATGRWILTYHHVPTLDVFSWTMYGKLWVTQEWLFETILAWTVNHSGFLGAWTVLVLFHSLTVLTLYRLGVLCGRGNRVLAALLACVGTLVALPFWNIRPQIGSYLLFALFLWIFKRARAGAWLTLLYIPLLMLVWGNLHGSAGIGIAMLIFEAVASFLPSFGRFGRESGPRKASVLFLACAGVGFGFGLLNPNGMKEYTYAFLSTNSFMTDNIMEWHSPNFHSEYYQFGVLPFLVITFAVLMALRGPVPLRETLYFAGALALTLVHQRFLPYAGICFVPLMSSVLGTWGRVLLHPSRFMRVLNFGILIATLAFGAWQTPKLRGTMDQHLSASSYPVAAVNELVKNHYPGPLLNSYEFGGYLCYRGIPTFVDGRTDVFLQGSVFRDYLALKNIWWNCPDLLEQYHFRTVLFPPGDSLITYLTHDPNWRVVYRDDVAVIMVKNTTPSS